MSKKKLVIISGTSGSGKSTALNAFEDQGFFCVDNLPSPLITHFVDLLCVSDEVSAPTGLELQQAFKPSREEVTHYALLVDCRHEQSFPYVWEAVEKLRKSEIEVSLLFFDCQDESAVRRYRETRRPHPLLLSTHSTQTIAEALAKERELLSDFREAATRVIDTTAYSPHDLRKFVEQYCDSRSSLDITVLSFGFKYGVPSDVDLLVDVRFLANPHFVEELRQHTGLEKSVAEYVFRDAQAGEFIDRYLNLLDFLIPKYEAEGKRYLTLGVGCTGGRHRSVAIAVRFEEALRSKGLASRVRHRDIQR